jgi:hypothetical protein
VAKNMNYRCIRRNTPPAARSASGIVLAQCATNPNDLGASPMVQTSFVSCIHKHYASDSGVQFF